MTGRHAFGCDTDAIGVTIDETGRSLACRRLTGLLRRPTSPCRMSCMRIKRSGRLGNNILQLIGAAHFGILSGVDRVFFPRGLVWQTQSFSMHGVMFYPEEIENEECFDGVYMTSPSYPDRRILNQTLKPFDLPRDFKLRIADAVGVKHVLSDALYMHVRSGDIFRLRPNSEYGQPPCRYYSEAWDLTPYRMGVVVGEDLKNPCMSYLISRGATWARRNLTSDLRLLLGCKNLVLARGSLGVGIAAVSLHLVTVFTFDRAWKRYFYIPCAIDCYNCVPIKLYKSGVLDYWRADRKQLIRVLTDSCGSWERLRFDLEGVCLTTPLRL